MFYTHRTEIELGGGVGWGCKKPADCSN